MRSVIEVNPYCFYDEIGSDFLRPSTGTNNLKFHHDNARPHVHSSVISYLKQQNFVIMDHSPYSPDLAPSDLWLFDYTKQHFDSQPDVESLAKAIKAIVESIPKQEYLKTFEKWIERMELCIKHEGHYFEHLTLIKQIKFILHMVLFFILNRHYLLNALNRMLLVYSYYH